jgi:hypothetical protein
MRTGVVCLVVWALASAGLAAVIRVPQDYTSIQLAVNAAKAGDTILIAPGVYSESVTVLGKKNLVLKGDVVFDVPEQYECCPPIFIEVGKVVLAGPLHIINSSDITIESLTVIPGGVIVQGAFLTPATNITLKYVQIIQANGDGLRFIGWYKNVNIYGCDISHNGADGIDLADQGETVVIEKSCINWNGRLTPTGVGVRIGPNVKNVVIRGNCLIGNAFAAIHPG